MALRYTRNGGVAHLLIAVCNVVSLGNISKYPLTGSMFAFCATNSAPCVFHPKGNMPFFSVPPSSCCSQVSSVPSCFPKTLQERLYSESNISKKLWYGHLLTYTIIRKVGDWSQIRKSARCNKIEKKRHTALKNYLNRLEFAKNYF